MKRLLIPSVLLFLSLTAASAGVMPNSQALGSVSLVETGSVEAFVLDAVSEEFSLDWVGKYAVGEEAFAVAYSPLLSSILPLREPLLSLFDGNQIKVRSLQDGRTFTFVLENGRIAALLED